MRLSVFWVSSGVISFLLLALVVIHWLTTPTANLGSFAEQAIPVQAQTVPEGWSLTVVGDIMLDRHVRTLIQRHRPEYFFETIRSELTGDVVVGNLEGPFTDRPTVATDNHLIFTFDPRLASTLREVGFTHLSLANNHTLNFGTAGLAQTREVVTTAGLKAFGDPTNATGWSIKETVQGERVAFVGFHGLVRNQADILSEIQAIKAEGYFVIVMPHWGNEYQTGIQPRVQAQAHSLVEAGADVILGAHPHVIEPFEIYRGKFIAYSLGNFLFDQYFSSETQQGMLLHLDFTSTTITLSLKPVAVTSRPIQLLPDPVKQTLLERLSRDSIVDESLRQSIQSGKLVITR